MPSPTFTLAILNIDSVFPGASESDSLNVIPPGMSMSNKCIYKITIPYRWPIKLH